MGYVANLPTCGPLVIFGPRCEALWTAPFQLGIWTGPFLVGDMEGVAELPCPCVSPLALKLKVHFRKLWRVFRPPPPRSKARMPPLSKAWKAQRSGATFHGHT